MKYFKRKDDGKLFKLKELKDGNKKLISTRFQLIETKKESLGITDAELTCKFEEVWVRENEFEKLLSEKKYSFLRKNQNLSKNIIMINVAGSFSYGTNIDSSDLDIRAVAYCPTVQNLGIEGLGRKYKDFEVYVDNQTDTTIYSLNKFLSLLIKCNPNIIEMLGCKEDHYIYLDKYGKMLLENKKIFLSQTALYSFGGYATSQLRRLENAVAHDKLSHEQKELHISNSVNNAIYSFKNQFKKLKKNYNIKTKVGKVQGYDEKQLLVTIKLKNFPMRELNGMCQQMTAITREYDKLNHRNNKKDDEHLNKHAMHLVRLYLMCFDICERQDIITYREKDRDLLMSIRKGVFQNNDGTYKKEFFDMISSFDNMLNNYKKKCDLPEQADCDKVADLYLKIVKEKENEKN